MQDPLAQAASIIDGAYAKIKEGQEGFEHGVDAIQKMFDLEREDATRVAVFMNEKFFEIGKMLNLTEEQVAKEITPPVFWSIAGMGVGILLTCRRYGIKE